MFVVFSAFPHLSTTLRHAGVHNTDTSPACPRHDYNDGMIPWSLFPHPQDDIDGCRKQDEGVLGGDSSSLCHYANPAHYFDMVPTATPLSHPGRMHFNPTRIPNINNVLRDMIVKNDISVPWWWHDQALKDLVTKKASGRKLSPLYMRKAEFMRWIETKTFHWDQMGSKIKNNNAETTAAVAKDYPATRWSYNR